MSPRALGLAAVALALARSPALAQTAAQPADTSIYKFVLDYDVPESPAFAALGMTSGNVLRGSAAKPIVVNVATSALLTGKLSGGLAIDVSPMVFARPTFTSFSDYQHSFAGRVLRRLLFSLGTIPEEGDSASLRVGAGARVTFIDRNDPLMDRRLYDDVNSLLQSAAPPAPRPGQSLGGVGAPIALSSADSMAALYNRARERVRNQPGLAISAGWGGAALLRGSVISRDSLRQGTSNLWVSGRYKLRGPSSVLATGQWIRIGGAPDDLRMGAAMRAEFDGVSAAGELVYDSFTHSLQPGGNAELRVLPGTRVVLGISADPPRSASDTHPRLRLRTQLKWDFAEMSHR